MPVRSLTINGEDDLTIEMMGRESIRISKSETDGLVGDQTLTRRERLDLMERRLQFQMDTRILLDDLPDDEEWKFDPPPRRRFGERMFHRNGYLVSRSVVVKLTFEDGKIVTHLRRAR
jgi:hypothetical protein